MKVLSTIGDLLLLCLTFQGLVLAAIIFYSSRKIKSNRWLAAFIFLISYSTLGTEILTSAIPGKFPWIYFVIPQLRLALGPILYFYTRTLLSEKQRLTGRDCLNFVPLIFEMGPQIAFIVHFSGLLSFPAIKNWYVPFESLVMNYEASNLSTLPFFFSFLTYLSACYKIILVSESNPNQNLSAFRLKDAKWLRTLIITLFPIVIIWLITIVLNYLPLPQLFYVIRYIMSLLAIGFAYWLGMAAYSRQAKMSVNDLAAYQKSPGKIYFSSDEAELYQKQLFVLMEKEQLYLNPALKLDLVADKIALSEKQLSNLLNQHLSKSFNDFINEYRVLEAKKKLADTTYSRFTIASIAFECGFNSLATFQRCFKQFAGITPSQYQNNQRSSLSQQNSTQIPI
ncbi:helix-turn-helix domain-containing protein [Mucilaginibacter sp. FT3.2]|uniref:helix-turn-helix domain-containing protein n=1 Tax=Mucilaginibacter sp. FT3.2 TaxID=2723090 RepID=UPI0016155D4B|nr:helix-turn-helix domain-containing protein [Mucilaginibacter sp. FT3.2]MBB6234991.1 AraC-like DNA-binding protein [Mucilaginibacter sp. FT3.2]